MTSKVTRTSKGEPMDFVTFEDTTGFFETIFFPKTFEKYGRLILSSSGPFIISGKVESERGALTVTVHRVEEV